MKDNLTGSTFDPSSVRIRTGLYTRQVLALFWVVFIIPLAGLVFMLTGDSLNDDLFERLIVSASLLLVFSISRIFPPLSKRFGTVYNATAFLITLWSVFVLYTNNYSPYYIIAFLLLFIPLGFGFSSRGWFVSYVILTALLTPAMAFLLDFPAAEPLFTLILFPAVSLFMYLFHPAGWGKEKTSGTESSADCAFFARFPDALLMLDPETGMITDCNKEAVKLFEAETKEKLIKKNIRKFYSNPDSTRDLLTKSIESREYEFNGKEVRFYSVKKRSLDVQISFTDLDENDDKKLLIRISDITHRRMMEEALQKSEERFRALVENNYEAIMIINTEGIVQYVSPAIKDTLGYAQYEYLHAPFFDIIHEDDLQVAGELLRIIVGGEKDSAFTIVRGRNKEGAYKWLEITATNKLGVSGVDGIILYLRDVSESKESEITLKESEARHRFLFEHSPLGIIRYDGTYAHVECNSALLKTLHLPKGLNSVYSLEELTDKALINVLNRALAGENVITEGSFSGPRGEDILYLQIYASPVVLGDGKVSGGIAIIEDISARKKSEIELIRAKDKAEEANRIKSAFLANMSHELRTPMNSILGFSQVLRDELTDPQQKVMVETMLRAGLRLMGTLNSILDLSLIETGEVVLTMKSVEFVDYTEFIVEKHRHRAEEKSLIFRVRSLTKDDIAVLIDEKMYHQCIDNLLDNAIKFTDSGYLEIELDSKDKYAMVRVKDTGIGLTDKDMEIIFHEFRQVSEGYNRRFEGSGLGLPLVKRIMELMNGKVEVESELGVGSTFTIFLPVEETADKSKVKKTVKKDTFEVATSIGHTVRPEILLVEDNPMNVEVTVMFLRKICDVAFAQTGLEAIRMIKKKQYSVVLMDINLGKEMSGIETAHEIKKHKNYAKVPIIALTGYAMAGDREKLLNEGFHDYLAKPIVREELRDLLLNLFKLQGIHIS
ncbi:MAG: PAS domain S-box protein [Ignavibacteriaceae bacterium]|nr:PAS domain S-box protein [Ignavibacteriaceae bacterium]